MGETKGGNDKRKAKRIEREYGQEGKGRDKENGKRRGKRRQAGGGRGPRSIPQSPIDPCLTGLLLISMGVILAACLNGGRRGNPQGPS